jgi:choline/glycine/proline betaine transport protein
MADWKDDLNAFFNDKEQQAKMNEEKSKEAVAMVETFISTVVKPAFEELKAEFEKNGKEVNVSVGPDSASIVIDPNKYERFDYRIRARGSMPYTEQRSKTEGQTYRWEEYLRSSNMGYTAADITKDEIISHFIRGYKSSARR